MKLVLIALVITVFSITEGVPVRPDGKFNDSEQIAETNIVDDAAEVPKAERSDPEEDVEYYPEEDVEDDPEEDVKDGAKEEYIRPNDEPKEDVAAADSKKHKGHGTRAVYNAINSILARVALNAINAKVARHSLYAKRAENAAFAKKSRHALNAQHALNATMAESAVNAKFAGHAKNAMYAVIAVNAKYIVKRFPKEAENWKNKMIEAGELARAELKPDIDMKPYRVSSCTKHLARVKKIKMLGKFKPKCRKDGLYADRQCFAGHCWCADILTGKEIKGTRRGNRKGKPKCAWTATALASKYAMNAVAVRKAANAINSYQSMNAAYAFKARNAMFAEEATIASNAGEAVNAKFAKSAINAMYALSATNAKYAKGKVNRKYRHDEPEQQDQ